MSIVQAPSVIGSEHNGMLMTAGEFDSAEEWDDINVYELINGVLVVNPPPSIGERGPNELLGRLLWNYHDQHPQGSSLDYTVGEHLVSTPANRRRADRVIWTGLGRVPDVDRDLPSIVVEFVSAGRRSRVRDYEAKRNEYGDLGIIEYWIIDRFQRQMTVIRYSNSQQTAQVVEETGTYLSPLLPGFELAVGRLIAEADRFSSGKKP